MSACRVAACRTGNAVSEAHAAEVTACAGIVSGCYESAEDRLLRALAAYEQAQHLGCSLHCFDAIAWLADRTERREQGAELLGLTETLRLDLGRVDAALRGAPPAGASDHVAA